MKRIIYRLAPWTDRLAGTVLVVGLLALGCSPATHSVPSAPQPTGSATPAVTIQVATADAIMKEIAAHKGDIIVVDNWATWCGPCKREFPELVKLSRKHVKDGVLCMSVSLDFVEKRDDAVAFLTDHQANFPNFLIEDQKAWAEKWNIKSIPMVLVFGRDGRLARKFDKDDPDNAYTYADVEKLVDELNSAKQPTSSATPATDVKIQVANADAIIKEIATHKGDVIVVDNWASWCGPCKREFPELVKLSRNYAKDGVLCMSVSLDEAGKSDDALAFLTAQKAGFSNFLVEDDKVWTDKWNIKSIPMVLVFGRDGQLARKFDREDPDNPFTYADVEKLVQELSSKGK